MSGRLILIEGTDCSGKQTQSELLVKRLNENGRKTITLPFPMYDTPTGKIIGGPYLGKETICESWFSEGATNVDARVASLYFAADRLYNIHKINALLKNGTDVILDRYTYSNMAHQGGKIADKEKRDKLYKWIDTLEFELIGLPRPDLIYLLYMPYQYSRELRSKRKESLDAHERSEEHLKNAETAYLEIAKKYNFKIINCVKNNKIQTIDEINNELYENVMAELTK